VMALVTGCLELEYIYLSNNDITNASVMALANGCPELKEVWLEQDFANGVTDAAVEALRNSHGGIEVYSDYRNLADWTGT